MAWFDYRHVPSLAFDTSLSPEIEAIAVGWIGFRVPRKGRMDESDLAAIEHARRYQVVDTGQLGCHPCLPCRLRLRHHEHRGEFLVRYEDRVYVIPQMITHYIRSHHYLPPQEFLDDLRGWWRHQTSGAGQVFDS